MKARMPVSDISAQSCWGRRSKGAPPPSGVPIGGAHCVPANPKKAELFHEKFCLWQTATGRCEHRPLQIWIKIIAKFIMCNKAELRRGEGTPPYSLFLMFAASHKMVCRARCPHRAGEKPRLLPQTLQLFAGDDGLCHISHHIILHKAAGAQCAPLRSLYTKMLFALFYCFIREGKNQWEPRK